jgi:5-methylcytosine-specific restriction endonuclease McrA
MTDVPRTEKRCPKCGETKPIDAFAKDPTKSGGRRSHCKVCTNSRDMTEYRRNYDAAHAEEIRLRKQKYYLENKERIDQQHRDYYETNKETTLERQRAAYVKNPRLYLDRSKAWELTHRDVRRAIGANRRARKKENGGAFTPEELIAMRAAQAGICVYCLFQYDPDELTIDHIIPITHGGPHEATNICLACEKCNKSKNNRTLEQWVRRWYWRKPYTYESWLERKQLFENNQPLPPGPVIAPRQKKTNKPTQRKLL